MSHRLLSTASKAAGKIKVELCFDVISPYSYFQFEMLSRRKQQWPKMDLHLTPVFNYAVITGSGNQTGMVSSPNKGMYTFKDSKRIAEFHKVSVHLVD